MKGKYFRKIILIIAFLLPIAAFAQDKELNAHSPSPTPSTHLQKAAEKKKAVQRAKSEKDEAKGVKRLQKMQTKEVQKRMRKSRREANRINANKKKFFLVRWFQKKHR